MEETTGWPEYSSSTNVSVKKPDNPQAYPCLDSSGFGLSMRDPGMTLRDWFAGQALAGLLAHASGEDPFKSPAMAFTLADAMLAARIAEGGVL